MYKINVVVKGDIKETFHLKEMSAYDIIRKAISSHGVSEARGNRWATTLLTRVADRPQRISSPTDRDTYMLVSKAGHVFDAQQVARFIASQEYVQFEFQVRGKVATHFGCSMKTATKWVDSVVGQGLVKRSGKAAICLV